MAVPVISGPPVKAPMVDSNGNLSPVWQKWFQTLYQKTGESTTVAPLSVTGTSLNITALLNLQSQVQGALASLNLSPNTVTNVTTFATVDSIDAGSDATIRVYGSGGVGTTWTRQVGASTLGPYAAGTLLGNAYGTKFDVYFKAAALQFYVFNHATQFANSLDDSLEFVGQVTTVASGGGGGTSGGGGSTGGAGGGRYNGL